VRWLVVVGVAVVLLGGGLLVARGDSEDADRGEPEPRAGVAEPRPGPPVLLAWSTTRLEAGVGREIPQIDARVVVHRGQVLLRRSRDRRGRSVRAAPAGFGYLIAVDAFDPRGYARLLPADAREPFRRLDPGEALLSQSSARVRRLGRGGVLVLSSGRRLRVEGVVPDAALRGAELAVDTATGRRLGVTRARHALLAYRGEPARAVRAVRATRRDAGGRRRVRDLGRGPWTVGGRVLPAALLKARFGEFALAEGSLPEIAVDPAWTRRWIAAESVPILGRVSCHRRMIPALRRALAELERRGLSRLVDPADYAGCFAPGTIPASGSLSQHSWGVAIDLNARANPYGARSRQDPRLVRILARHGFAWGGRWPTPDAMHFEYRG
jgi:hypothetical protein